MANEPKRATAPTTAAGPTASDSAPSAPNATFDRVDNARCIVVKPTTDVSRRRERTLGNADKLEICLAAPLSCACAGARLASASARAVQVERRAGREKRVATFIVRELSIRKFVVGEKLTDDLQIGLFCIVL